MTDNITMFLEEIKSDLAEVKRSLDLVHTRLNAAGIGVLPASDEVLDGSFGDIPIWADPKDWKGESQVGKKMSECDLDYLYLYRKRLLWLWQKDYNENKEDTNGRPRAPRRKKDLELCEGWIKRKEALLSKGSTQTLTTNPSKPTSVFKTYTK